MASSRSELLTAALQLSPEERAVLAQEILDSTRSGDFETDVIAQAWAEEIHARLGDIDAGIELRTWDDLNAELVEAEEAHAR